MIELRYTGVDQHGQALQFYYDEAPELIERAEELRQHELQRLAVGQSDGPQPPSISLTHERSNAAEGGIFTTRGPRATPRRDPRDGR
ncbi:hypothetical protein [Chloroflexus islandicus]|uniref:hypothetical protein n=1 Tax=Chloroflexus islandicus TaxID=1707952 RepID=UPI000A59826E|nr:hypothetical protein [Chloroflexus islandicus]